MKKSLLTSVILGMFCMAAQARQTEMLLSQVPQQPKFGTSATKEDSVAQNLAKADESKGEITVYGILDAGLGFANKVETKDGDQVVAKNQLRAVSGGLTGSRWGIKGSEDIGNGLKGLFVLEGGFDVNRGSAAQGGLIFGRELYVGLGGDFGTVSVGRQREAIAEFVSPLTGDFSDHPGDFDNLGGTSRFNNSVKFRSVDYNGFGFGGVYSVGGEPGSRSKNSAWSVAGNYKNDVFTVAAGYLQANDPNTSFFGVLERNPDGTPKLVNNFGNRGGAVLSGFANATKFSVAAVGGNYKVGPASLGVVYSRAEFSDFESNDKLKVPGAVLDKEKAANLKATPRLETIEAILAYQVSPQLKASLGYSHTKGNYAFDKDGLEQANLEKPTYEEINAGLGYDLSVRTKVYGAVSYQKAKGTASDGQPAKAKIGVFDSSNGDKQTTFLVGLVHKF